MNEELTATKTEIKPMKPNSGKTTIAPDVLMTITRLTTLRVPGVARLSQVPGGVNRLLQDNDNEGVRLVVKNDTVTADLYIVLEPDMNIAEVSRNIQSQVARAITDMVGMKVGKVNIHVEEIDYSDS